MDQTVAKTYNLQPGNLWILKLDFHENPVRRFANDLKQTDKSQVQQTVRIKVRPNSALA
jgi:hypothetical protein